jgi:CPA1 family monovalent cation:H+ antiporter
VPDAFNLFAALTSLTALFSWLNYRYLKLPTVIGLMVIALVFSLVLVLAGKLFVGLGDQLALSIEGFSFGKTLLQGMLGALLFAGALHVKIDDLMQQKFLILLLVTLGLVTSTLLVGGVSFLLFGFLGLGVPFIYCLLFGALISPTDPVAVLAILKRLGVPRTLESKIAGEALFNDGAGIVLFLVLLEVAQGGHEPTAASILVLLAKEVLGGVAAGLVIGWVAYRLLKSVDNYQVEILVTVAVVTGGYAVAQSLETSGALAMVVAGLLIGNTGRLLAMSERTEVRLDDFWELVDEFLNAILFVMIGLEAVVISFQGTLLIAGALSILSVLVARLISVGLPVTLLRTYRSFSPHAVKIMTWGGLRGGISVALALSIPPGPERDALVAVTYAIVCFSIIVQGLSVGPVIQRLYPSGDFVAGRP